MAKSCMAKNKISRSPLMLNNRSGALLMLTYVFILTCLYFITYSLLESHQRRQQGNAWVSQTSAYITGVEAVRTLTLDAETGTRGFLLSGQPAALEPFDRARAQLPIQLASLRQQVRTRPAQQTQVDQLQQLVAHRMTISEQEIALFRQGMSNRALTEEMTRGKPAMDRLRAHITQMIRVDQGLLEGQLATLSKDRQLGKSWLFSLVGLGVLMGLTVLLLGAVLRQHQKRERQLRQLVRERGEALQLKAQQQAYLEGIINGSLNGLVSCAPVYDQLGQLVDLRIVMANPAASRLTGRPAKQLVGKTLLTEFPVLGTTSLMALLLQTAYTGQGQQEETLFKGDGQDAWFEVIATPLPEQSCLISFVDISSRKQAERQWQESTQLLKAITDETHTAVGHFVAVRPPEARQSPTSLTDFRLALVNPAYATILGRSQTDLQGHLFSEVLPGSLYLVPLFETVLTTGTPLRQPVIKILAQEAEIWLDLQVVPYQDGLIVTFTDITALKEYQFALQRQAELLSTTLDASISSILVLTAIRDEGGQITDFLMEKANRAVEQSLGKTTADLEGRTILEVFPGNVENGFFELYTKATETGISQQATLHYSDINGFEGWFDISAVKQATNKIVVTFINVTAYKQTEERVRQQTDLLQSILNTTLDTVTTYQAIRDQTNQIVDFRFTLANQAALSVVNMTTDELYAKTLLEVSPDLRHNAVLDQYISVVQTGQPVTLERQRQGRWFLANVVRFGSDGLLTSSIDITSLKQAQFQIEGLNQRLQRSNASLDQFAAIASHDLQEPLRKILTFGKMLTDEYGPVLGQGLPLLQRIQSAADRMQALILGLLNLSRYSQAKGIQQQPTDLDLLVTQVLMDLDLTIKEKQAVVDLDPLPILMGDALQLRQVFQNLLTNALKFVKPGQTPRVRITSEQKKGSQLPSELNLSRSYSQVYWLITVSDQGIGFGSAYRERIFGAFERLHGRSSPYAGTGIGLAIVRRVMDNHQGAVTAHSEPGQGASFTLYFPSIDCLVGQMRLKRLGGTYLANAP